ncbi:MAG: NAD-dependent epimerase/dehydratase family protein [Pseudomonadota bacterium]
MTNAVSADASVLATGLTGFIGQRLQRQLATRTRLIALVRPGRERRAELMPGVTELGIDLTNTKAWESALATHSPSALILLAGTVRGRTLDDFRPANVAAIRACVDAVGRLRPAARPRVLLVSSLAASAPALSHYAASKREGEAELERLDADWSILRPPPVHGPGDAELTDLFRAVRTGLVPRLGPRHQRIPFLHGDDLALAICAWLARPAAATQQVDAIHDGTPDGYGWSDIAAQIRGGPAPLELPVPRILISLLGHGNAALARLFNYAPMLTPGKARELCYDGWLCDNARFTAATDWQPTLRLADTDRAAPAPDGPTDGGAPEETPHKTTEETDPRIDASSDRNL